jgi:hypothetical protein
MPVHEIKFFDPDIPFEAASVLLSFIAYPTESDERSRFAGALCRLEHRQETLRDPRWRSSAKLVRPHIFFDATFEKTIQEDVNNLLLRIVIAVSMLVPHLHVDRGDGPALEIFDKEIGDPPGP